MLVGKEIDIEINKVFSYLDTLDLLHTVNEFKNKKLYDLMTKLEELYPYNNGCSVTLFDVISEDEFADYLNKKYNLRIMEETISYYYIR
jgi:hypothetical protein